LVLAVKNASMTGRAKHVPPDEPRGRASGITHGGQQEVLKTISLQGDVLACNPIRFLEGEPVSGASISDVDDMYASFPLGATD
jgi:hypothetical protein